MELLGPLALVWLLAINLATFVAFGRDKRASLLGRRRVPEARLLWLALPFGAPGAWIGARVFRHKTVKRSFRLRLWAVTLLQVVVAGLGLWTLWRDSA